MPKVVNEDRLSFRLTEGLWSVLLSSRDYKYLSALRITSVYNYNCIAQGLWVLFWGIILGPNAKPDVVLRALVVIHDWADFLHNANDYDPYHYRDWYDSAVDLTQSIKDYDVGICFHDNDGTLQVFCFNPEAGDDEDVLEDYPSVQRNSVDCYEFLQIPGNLAVTPHARWPRHRLGSITEGLQRWMNIIRE
jgi:hypothetical protein